MTRTDSLAVSAEEEAAYMARWRREARREAWRWRVCPDGCPACGERIWHFGGSVDRDPCELIPLNVPLDEVRPNCYAVRRLWIGDAIRAACDAKG